MTLIRLAAPIRPPDGMVSRVVETLLPTGKPVHVGVDAFADVRLAL